MASDTKPTVISDPTPRTLDLIFTPSDLDRLKTTYDVVEVEAHNADAIYREVLPHARYIIGQPDFGADRIAQASGLRAIFNVEGNFVPNVDYDRCFERGIHVLTTSSVFAQPVAEIGLGFALSLLRDIPAADRSFREGTEIYGLDGNLDCRLLSECEIGFIGFGDLGHALMRLIRPFNAPARIHDPWLPASHIAAAGAEPADLDTVLSESDVIFVVASVTDTNKGFLGAREFARMRPGASFILLSRAGVVDFDAMMAAARSGHIRIATDVFPKEPLPADHPVRTLPHAILSAHRAGALDSVFTRMGEMVLEDMALMDQSLPPRSCKRAERETVSRMRSMAVTMN